MKRLAKVARSIVWCTGLAFRTAPVSMTVTVIIRILVAFIPSAQVLLVNQLTQALMRHDFATSLAWAIATGILVASSYGLNSIGFSLQRLAQIPMATWCNEAINSYLYHQEPKELENSDTGDQARQARDAIDSGSLTLQAFSLLSLISSAIVCISLTVTIWRSSWVSAVLVLLSLFPSVIEYMVFADVEQKQWPKIMKVSRRARYFEDILTYEKPAVELAHDAAGGYVAGLASQGYRRRSRMSRRLELVDLFLALAATAMTAVLIIFALVALVDAHAPVAMVAGTVVGVLSGISATSDVGYELGNMIRASVSISSFLHMLDADSAASSHAGSMVDPAAPAKVVGLDVDGLSAFYDQERRVGVSGVSLHARKGQIVAFVGRNGAGKTTTVKALTGMLASEQGTITLTLEGEKGAPQGRNLDLGSMDFFSRRPYMSVMVQDYNRFELTVRQNVALGKIRDLVSVEGKGEVCGIGDSRVLWDALDQVGQKEVVEGLPQGIDTQLGSQWGGVDVSGGQWQRLTLARALAAQAPVLILDEPTSNVDSQSEEEILRNLVRHKQGRITILVTHRAWTLKSADVIYVFEAGRIVDQGTYESLCERSKVFQDLFELQIKAGRGPDDADACSDEAA